MILLAGLDDNLKPGRTTLLRRVDDDLCAHLAGEVSRSQRVRPNGQEIAPPQPIFTCRAGRSATADGDKPAAKRWLAQAITLSHGPALT